QRLVSDNNLLEKIREIGNQEKIKYRSNIFGFYEEQRKLNELALTYVLYCVPPTLALLLDEIRCRMSATTIDQVLSIFLNQVLVSVNFRKK
ncbi:hypothetical protein Bhyg_16046, partial [Pseudolycoriella hygida]